MNRNGAKNSQYEEDITSKLESLSLNEKVRILTGSSAWKLHPLDSIGLRSLVMSDGPAGVRGVSDSPSETSASFPSPSAVSATWDLSLIERVGELFAAEGKRHGADVVLMPVVNLQRTPVGGRHFECFSEDPLLTSQVAVSLVSAMQNHGVGGCVKHLVANDSETARTEYVARIDERTLREVYLAPFESVVHDAAVWTIMAAYNGLDDGVETNSATDHHHLLTDIVKGEWQFDGVMVSDWTAASSTAPSANAGLDLVMPGPGGPWEDALLKAVNRGEVSQDTIDDKVRRILRLAYRSGAFDTTVDSPVQSEPTGAQLLREVAARSTVVLKDDHRQLPHAASDVSSVALIGPNAVDTFLQGGGSAWVNPDHVVTPAQGLSAALPSHARVEVHRGGYSRPHMPGMDMSLMHAAEGGPTGCLVEFLNASGESIRSVTYNDWNGWIRNDVPDGAITARISTTVHLEASGTHWIGVGTVGAHSIWVDGELVSHDATPAGGEVILNSSVNAPPSSDHPVTVDQPRNVEVQAELQIFDAEGWGRFVRATFRHQLPGPTIDDEIAAAVAAAKDADLAVVVVGTNSEVESEGWDRTDLSLPGRQDELVARVAQENPNTIVVVNAGAPVLLPWLDQVPTVLWSWFPGQECGHALADVIFGRTEPSGRLPWTLPANMDQVPVPHAIPEEGIVHYNDGIHVGYRGYLKAHTAPAAPFGHGLGWTDWEYSEASTQVESETGNTLITVTVANTGPRHGHETVQVYAEAIDSPVERPVRWLAGFASVSAGAGESVRASVSVTPKVFHVWDCQSHNWIDPTTQYRLHIGRSVEDIRLSVDINR